MIQLQQPYLMFLGDAHDELAAKTALGILHWRRDLCIGQIKLPGCVPDLGLEDLTIEQAVERGVKTMVIGVANAGGVIPANWTETIIKALDHGLDVAAGLHSRLAAIPAVLEAAKRNGRSLHDVRHPKSEFATGKGTPRTGKRLLPVGTDCSVGKMYTALAIEAEMHKRGMKADFRATGQTGIFVAGEGVSVDAVVADFISGATESLCPANEPDHWDLVEGQGSLFHPSFAGVSLGLIHGAQPDAIILCHEPTRKHMRGVPGHPIPDLKACIELNLMTARLTNPNVVCVGAAINTSRLPKGEVDAYLAGVEAELGIPCVDPVATGVGRLVDVLEKM